MTDPSDTIIIEGERERQGDYIFTAHQVGEHSFCFSNDMSSFSEKLVDFDIMVESEPRPVAPAKPTALTEQTSSLEESIYKLSGSLSSIQRTQKYFRTRENRNVSCRPRPAKCVPHVVDPAVRCIVTRSRPCGIRNGGFTSSPYWSAS